MRVIRNDKHIKTVPAKFSPVVDGFEFETQSRRLSFYERDQLSIRLCVLKIQEHFAERKYGRTSEMTQAIYAYESAMIGIISSVTEVKKRDGIIRYDVVFDGRLAVTVKYDLICDYPKGLILTRNEF